MSGVIRCQWFSRCEYCYRFRLRVYYWFEDGVRYDTFCRDEPWLFRDPDPPAPQHTEAAEQEATA